VAVSSFTSPFYFASATSLSSKLLTPRVHPPLPTPTPCSRLLHHLSISEIALTLQMVAMHNSQERKKYREDLECRQEEEAGSNDLYMCFDLFAKFRTIRSIGFFLSILAIYINALLILPSILLFVDNCCSKISSVYIDFQV
jgi:hypothetical protein